MRTTTGNEQKPLAHELGVLFVLYGYAAFTYERYADALGSVTGVDLKFGA